MARTGRPSKFTPETRKALIDAITAGLTYTHACELVGIEYETFVKWRQRGKRETEGEYFQFIQDITRAETITATTMMALIRKAAPDDWRAAAWWLERRYAHEYGKQVHQVEHSGKVTITWEDQAVEDIRAGRVTYPALAEAFDDSTASRLFAAAGIPVSVGTGESEE